ncbi:MAG: PH domain-containing protein [Candidatus Nanopelagicales bacterium]
MIPVAIVIGIGVLGQFLAKVPLLGGALGILVVALLIAVLTAGFQYLAWQRLTFWFDDEGDFRIASGVLTRRERRLQLSRLQGVEVVQPLVARLFGMAKITLEVGGVGDSKAELAYLTLDDAQMLRNQVIARAAGLHPEIGEAPQEPLVTVPPRDLAVSLALRGSTVLFAVITIVVVVTTFISAGPVGLFFLLFGGIPLLMVGVEFARYYDFTVADSADGLRLRSGLFQVQAHTIPPGRVQAIEFEQSILWRSRDWVRVRLNVAGLASNDNDDDQRSLEQVLLPVAPYDVALAVVGRVLPGVDARAIPLEPAPRRAARRAWIQFRNLGVGHTDEVFVTERGRFVNRLAVVPHARSQSVRVRQGPWQRRLNLASMYVDSVPGPVTVKALHRDAVEARTLADAQNQRALTALAAAGTGRWMQRDQTRPSEDPDV